MGRADMAGALGRIRKRPSELEYRAAAPLLPGV